MRRVVEANPSPGWTIWSVGKPVSKLSMCRCFQMANPTTPTLRPCRVAVSANLATSKTALSGHIWSRKGDNRCRWCDIPSCDWAILGAGDMFRSFQCVAAFKRPIQRRRHISYVEWLISTGPTLRQQHLDMVHSRDFQASHTGTLPHPVTGRFWGLVTRLEASNVSLLSNGQPNDTDTLAVWHG